MSDVIQELVHLREMANSPRTDAADSITIRAAISLIEELLVRKWDWNDERHFLDLLRSHLRRHDYDGLVWSLTQLRRHPEDEYLLGLRREQVWKSAFFLKKLVLAFLWRRQAGRGSGNGSAV